MAGGSDFKPTFPQNNFPPSSELRVEFLTATNTAIPIIVHRFEGKMPLTDAVQLVTVGAEALDMVDLLPRLSLQLTGADPLQTARAQFLSDV